jgi:hypothetical protein
MSTGPLREVRFLGVLVVLVAAGSLVWLLARRPGSSSGGGAGRQVDSPKGGSPGAPDLAGSLPASPGAAGSGEEGRKALYQEFMTLEPRAKREAERALPDPQSAADPLSPGDSSERGVRQTQKREALAKALLQKYRARLAAQRHLSADEVTALLAEGKEKAWPLPPAEP